LQLLLNSLVLVRRPKCGLHGFYLLCFANRCPVSFS
jgi:hypothetical protein